MTKTITVIGSGPGGYECAIRAAQLGANVNLIENGELGGTCLNRGCIPTKAYWRNAEVADLLQRKEEFGFNFEGDFTVDGKKLQERKVAICDNQRNGVEFLVGSYSNIKLYRGTGSFKSDKVIQVDLNEGGTEEIETDYTIIATGSEPSLPPIEGVDTEGVMTSDEILDIDYIPESLVVIGGGVIGLEFACIYAKLGTEVTVITNEVLGTADGEISKRLPRFLKQQGINLINKARASKIEKTDDGYKVTAGLVGKDGTKEAYGTDVLVAAGRRAYMKGLNPEAAGIKVEKWGVPIDENMMTNVDGIYAIGDVTEGSMQLAHWASFQGISVVENILEGSSEAKLEVVPAATFTFPEVAQVGPTEEELKEAGIPYKVGKFNYGANGKAVSMGETEGFVKVIADEDLSQLLACHIIGPHASDLVHEATVAITGKISVDDLVGTIHAHPTLSETLMEAIHQLKGASIHSAPAK